VDLDIVFLGTSGSMPTARRAPTALLLRRGGEKLLVDCAEGTQRQLLRSAVGLVELRDIFLTHYHADHYLGLPGMLKTFALRGRELPLTVYGPAGLHEIFTSLRRIFGRLTYDVQLEELDAGATVPRDGYRIEAFATRHAAAGVGFALVEDERPGRFDVEAADALGVPVGPERRLLQLGQPVVVGSRTVYPHDVLGPARPGRKVVISSDTAPAPSVRDAAAGADVLVHEATFAEEERERARETAHSTALDAARVADAAGVGLLALTHLSSRYFGPELAREARTTFPRTIVPRDFDTIDVPFADRGRPELVKGGALRERARMDGRSPGSNGGGESSVTRMVQVAVAGDIGEAEELREMLTEAGIDATLETAVEHHEAATENAPQKVLVPEDALEAAKDAIESLSEPDELVSDA
jgi:ribonuclease Z